MSKNENLHKAKDAKNNEFYTRMEDISKELSNYKKHFKDKIILCNFDDPEWSNFWIFFHQSFGEYGLKKLIATHYNKDGAPSYVMEYTGGNDIDPKDWHQKQLKGNGDFASDECVELLKEADICVTNPAFSEFRKFISLLMEYDKKFVIIGNNNAITYKEFFPLLKDNKVWTGYSVNKTMLFRVGEGYRYDEKETAKINDGYRYGKVPAITWFTNLDIPKRHESLVDILKNQYEKHLELYPKYDNYDAINVDKVKDIPYNYFGVMGVPITFLDKFNPDEFEIIGLGIANLGLECGVQPYKPHHKKYRKEIQHKGQVDGDLYMVDNNDHPIVPYARILIKRKEIH